MKHAHDLLFFTNRVFICASLLFFGITSVRAEDAAEMPAPTQTATQSPAPEALKYTVIKRVSSLEMYPCDDCHSATEDFNATKRQLTKDHDSIVGYHPLAEHDNADYWCLSCHEPSNYNKLRLHSGKVISMNEAYKICLQCHGNYKDEFENGIHGRKSGKWETTEPVFTSCPKCHDPHGTKFKAIKPDPAPRPLHSISKPTTETK